MKLFATDHPHSTAIDISSYEFWCRPLIERDMSFSRLRRDAPVSWHPPMDGSALAYRDHEEAGFWAVTRSTDISFVSRNHEIFSSALGGVTVRPRIPAHRQSAPSFLDMDPPEHNVHRHIISSSFTPRSISRLTAQIEDRATNILDAVVGVGEFDFVERVSSQLPMLTIADMIGVPESQVAAFTKAGNDMVMAADEGALPDGVNPLTYFADATATIRNLGIDLVNYRRAHPGDDLATALAEAKVEGRPLPDAEIASIVILLSVAGNDTTKHTTSWTAYNLCLNPGQRSWLAEDLEGRITQSIEEFIRHATVVNMFARTARTDTVLGEQQITAGDKVVMFYCSGNRDESVFPDAHRFDLTRPRVNHVAFGGGGVHFCLGSFVARAQLRAIFARLPDRLPGLELRGEPELLHNEMFNAVRTLPMASG